MAHLRARVALAVGHTRVAPGATAADGESEWSFNQRVRSWLLPSVDPDIEIIPIDRPERDDIAAEVRTINALDPRPELAVEMHFNAFDGRARGTEVLFWGRSGKSAAMAHRMLGVFLRLGLPNRGTKAIGVGGRGGYFLRQTAMPAVIVEPGFGDQAEDWAAISADEGRRLAALYLRAIRAALGFPARHLT